jgi:cation diffusion facilitator CzcD-associated flavoprotein CzcO
VLPARNQPIDPETGDAIKRNYDSIWHCAHDHAYGLALDPPGRTSKDVTAEEYERIFERGREAGGFTFICGCCEDLCYNAECNELACEFIRNKIHAIGKDPAVAELLCPTHPFYARPPPLGSQYYETYNRSNVSLVDVGSNAISDVTPTGVRLEDGTHHPLDMIVFALGFNAITGALTAIDCRGTHGQTLKETWQAHGTRRYGGLGPHSNVIVGCRQECGPGR